MAQPERLDRLAQQINEEHHKVDVAVGKAQTAMSSALLHAKRAGKLLVEVKERTRHGEWGRGSKQISRVQGGERRITCVSILVGLRLRQMRRALRI
jgi:hypothetical protein